MTDVSFTCICPSSFTGQYCETSIRLSDSTTCQTPCNNGGTCMNGQCLCTSQYVGSSCEYGKSDGEAKMEK